jgi:hypothetical protein
MEIVDFVPRGAVAFFISLIVLFTMIWTFVYWIMLQRG